MNLTSQQVRKLIRNQIGIISEQSDSDQIPADVMEMIAAGLEDISNRYSPENRDAERVIELILSLNIEGFKERATVESVYLQIFNDIERISKSIPIRQINDIQSPYGPAWVFSSYTPSQTWRPTDGIFINTAYPWNDLDSFKRRTGHSPQAVIDHEIKHVIRASFFKASRGSIDIAEDQIDIVRSIFDIDPPPENKESDDYFQYIGMIEERRAEISRLRDWIENNDFDEANLREAICLIKYRGFNYTGSNPQIGEIITRYQEDQPMQNSALRDVICPITDDIFGHIEAIVQLDPLGKDQIDRRSSSENELPFLAESISITSGIDNIREIVRRNIIYSDRKK